MLSTMLDAAGVEIAPEAQSRYALADGANPLMETLTIALSLLTGTICSWATQDRI
jgi:hypothetical protein